MTHSADIGSSSSPRSTPADIDTQTTPGTGDDEASTTSDSSSQPNSTNTSSDNTAMKVGLGVGLGVGLPLLALIGGGLYFLGKKRGGAGNALPDMPSVPPVSSRGAEIGWYPGAIVGGIENTDSQVGGAVRAPDGRT